MAERRHGGRRSDARGGGRGEGRGDLLNEEAARQRDLRDIENDDLRQQVRDLQRDIENGDLRQQVRDLQRRLARLEKRRGKSNPMRSNASERRSVDGPLFNDVCGGQSNPVYDKDILSMQVYDKPVYDEDILSMQVYDKPVYDEDEDILSMPVYDKPVYNEDIFSEIPGLMSKSSPTFVKFDDVNKGVVVDDDKEYKKDDDEEVMDRAKNTLQLAMTLLEDEFCHVLFRNTVPLDHDCLHHSTLSSSTAAIEIAATTFFNGDASESLEDVSSGRYSNHSHGRGVSFGGDDKSLELIHPDVLTELEVIADRMIRSGHEKECCQVYCGFQRDVIEKSMFILGLEKSSIEEVQKIGWKLLDAKMKKWNPEKVRRPDLEEAPVFYLSEEEFENTLKYISSICAQAEIYGIGRIVPPLSWKPPCPLKERDIWEKSKFATRVRRIDKLQNRNAMRKILQVNHNKKRKKRGRMKNWDEWDGIMIDAVGEILNGLRCYFNKATRS